jgi:glucose-1-phosphate cytidylyltransferase
MKTVLLCGGKGERLKEHGTGLPKALWKIGGKPLIWHVMSKYAQEGYTDFVLCTGYRHEDFVAHFNDLPQTGWKIILDNKGEDCGTAERLTSALQYISTENFFCNYGDGLSNLNLNQLLQAHITGNKIATLTAVKPEMPFGILEINEQNSVTEFQEKPKSDHWINGGFFVLSKRIEPFLALGKMLEKEPFIKLASEGQLQAYKWESKWQCMDTYKDFMNLSKLMEKGEAFWLK